MTPAELDAAYRAQVVENLTNPDADMRQTIEMLHWMDCNKGSCLSADQAGRTWVWSDLHLDHADAIRCFKRPFRNVEGMRQALFEAWRQAVAETDVVICLGDLTVGPANRTIDAALAGLPGEKILVAGNHDVGGRGKDYGFEAAYPTLVCETEPALLLTHEPLTAVPAGTVNVHGHLHGALAKAKALRSRCHLNVNCELTAYRPVRLAELATAAGVLLAGDIEPLATTAGTVARARRRRGVA